MKRRSFFGALAGLLLAPFVTIQKTRHVYVDNGHNLVAYSRRRPDWKPMKWWRMTYKPDIIYEVVDLES